jgi:phosphate:Na+ symporter
VSIYLVLLQLAGAVTLLIWAVRMVRTGMQRSQEPRIKRVLRESSGGRLKAAGIGLGLAVLLQGATAVAVLAAGFAATGTLTVATGLALLLGADVGSALVVQILTIKVEWLMPLLLIVGGALFFRGTTKDIKQAGRMLIGVALVLLSLRLIGEATEPLRTNPMLPAAVAYLRGDIISAFLVGAAFTWLLHSSVASLLLIATFALQGLLPIELGVSLMLGANLGGALIALGLTRTGSVQARQITMGSVLFRGIGAVIALLVFHLLDPPVALIGDTAARQIINLHLIFNGLLLVICLPLTGAMERLVALIVKPKPTLEAQLNPLGEAASCLDQSVVGTPGLALASATRELLRMAEIIERMLQPLMDIYATGDREKIRQARRMEEAVDRAQSEIKLYLAQIAYDGEGTPEARRGHDLSTFAINLEYVGDAIAKTLLKLAEVRRDQQLKFSPEGWRELGELHHQVMANMHLALNVLVSKDKESARQLVAEKDRMRSAVDGSYNQHLQRLKTGTPQSVSTSNIHLETIRTLKTINSLFATIGYSILQESGDLLESRLKGAN